MTQNGEAVALLGDAHLYEGDPEVGAFVDFLDRLSSRIGTLAILGDLFSAWIGRRELIRSHHSRVVEALRGLRRRGCRILYIEGNHDFFLTALYGGDPFDRIVSNEIDLRLGGRDVHLVHGDLINRRDRQYRAWRTLAKSRVFFSLFNLMPAAGRLRFVSSLEQRLATTNMAFRGGFPVDECAAYARRQIARGRELIVFGHFHEERRMEWGEGTRRTVVYVLPAWRNGHRYLRLEAGREPEFVSS